MFYFVFSTIFWITGNIFGKLEKKEKNFAAY